MRIQRVAIAATAALLGSFALTACGGANGTASAGGQVSVSASGSASAGSGVNGAVTGTTTGGGSGSGSTGSGTGSGGTGSTGGSGSTSGGSGSGSASGAGAAACTTAHLAFGIGPDSGPQAVGDTTAAEVVKLTNTGSADCAMHGFPGVDLNTNAGTIPVPRSKQTPRSVTLAPGASALFTIDYAVNNTGGSGVRVDTMVITPPNETHSHTLAWSEGTLPVTDGAGSGPGLDVDPVVPFPG
ncbi:DUF4232 domain-containing protein [Streptacidiphilus sp. 4-A2]|nr:DUF4232 domain-containing protein [Streptacidiphilus sp. 4-A2]